ncbi:MAG: helix-turn-helix transcriptional regulator, partial [Desulfobacterales bacterium]|nr:helix-turn-helix transcriptional regulator [Desulfobacterales bacterium]
MPQKSKYKLKTPPSQEPLGERLARLRKEQGHTQIELAEKIGITQVLVSNYERNRLRPNYDMIISFAQALGL